MRSSALVDSDAICDQLQTQVSFGGLSKVSLELLDGLSAGRKSDEKIVLVGGPTVMGGFGNSRKNLEVLNGAIDFVVSMGGVIVFDQVMFYPHFERIVNRGTNGWDNLNNSFFEPLLRSEQIEQLYMLPNWETSSEAVWIRNRGHYHNIDVEELSVECHSAFMTAAATT